MSIRKATSFVYVNKNKRVSIVLRMHVAQYVRFHVGIHKLTQLLLHVQKKVIPKCVLSHKAV